MAANGAAYRLAGFTATYGGTHHVSFVYNSKAGRWQKWDDAALYEYDSWQQVMANCAAGLLTPTLLTYSRAQHRA